MHRHSPCRRQRPPLKPVGTFLTIELEGAALEFELMEGYVILRKSRKSQGEDPLATFEECDSEADRRAYVDL